MNRLGISRQRLECILNSFAIQSINMYPRLAEYTSPNLVHYILQVNIPNLTKKNIKSTQYNIGLLLFNPNIILLKIKPPEILVSLRPITT